MPTKKASTKPQSKKAAPGPKGPKRMAASSRTVKRNPEVTAWFANSKHPLKDEMLQVREIILAADPRIEESIKWQTPTFSYNGNLASFIPQAKKAVSLMFHRGAEIPGKHPRLEGDGRLARTMRFEDKAAIAKAKRDIVRVVRAWCDFREDA